MKPLPRVKNLSGALADQNQAITLNPKNEITSFNPKFASPYFIRAILKLNHKDRAGAISDFRTAAKISRKNGSVGMTMVAIEALEKLGVTE